MISVIVPVYNARKFLNKCLKSIESQTYRDLEIILVNDCSKDDSLDIIGVHQKKDSRIIVVNKTVNEGVEKARFTGLKKATGQYVFFVDSDDWLPLDTLEKMLAIMNEQGCDVVKGAWKKYVGCFPWHDFKSCVPDYVGNVISHDTFMEHYYVGLLGLNNFPVNMCVTLYKRDIIDKANVSPCGASFGEDLVFNLKVLPYANSIYCTNDICYNYRVEVGRKWKYHNRWLENARLLYNIKNEYQKLYNVKHDGFYIHVEMINLLKTFISKMMDDKRVSEEMLVQSISRELEHDEYKGVVMLKNTRYSDQDVLEMILTKDAQSLYNYVQTIRKNEGGVSKFVRFLRSIL